MQTTQYQCSGCFTNNNTMDETLSTLMAMHRQETTAYQCYNYLKDSNMKPSTANGTTGTTGLLVNDVCRQKISRWCFQIIDFCQLSRESVSIAMGMLDRFMCTPAGQSAMTNRKKFQLAAITALYTTVKINEQVAMQPSLIAGLSKGSYSETDITAMEFEMLMALSWRVQPPTAVAFCRMYLALFSDDVVSEDSRRVIMEMASFQTELATTDGHFIDVAPSTIALAAIQNAFQDLGVSVLNANLLQMIPQSIASNAAQVQAVAQRLMEAATASCGGDSRDFFRSNHNSDNNQTGTPKVARSCYENESPRTVTNKMEISAQ